VCSSSRPHVLSSSLLRVRAVWPPCLTRLHRRLGGGCSAATAAAAAVAGAVAVKERASGWGRSCRWVVVVTLRVCQGVFEQQVRRLATFVSIAVL